MDNYRLSRNPPGFSLRSPQDRAGKVSFHALLVPRHAASLRIFWETFREGTCRFEIPLRLSLHQEERVVQCAFRGETENNERPCASRPKIPLSDDTHVILFWNRRLRVHTLVRNRPSRRFPQPGNESQN